MEGNIERSGKDGDRERKGGSRLTKKDLDTTQIEA